MTCLYVYMICRRAAYQSCDASIQLLHTVQRLSSVPPMLTRGLSFQQHPTPPTPPQLQVSDKLGGSVPPHAVASLSLDDIRRGGAERVKERLLGLLLEGECDDTCLPCLIDLGLPHPLPWLDSDLGLMPPTPLLEHTTQPNKPPPSPPAHAVDSSLYLSHPPCTKNRPNQLHNLRGGQRRHPPRRGGGRARVPAGGGGKPHHGRRGAVHVRVFFG